jgi:hypothetical protein
MAEPTWTLLSSALYYILLFVVGYVVLVSALASLVAVHQEYKIWKPKALPTLSAYGCIKVFLFNMAWMLLCFVGSILVLLRYVIAFGRTDVERDINRLVENWAARIMIRCFVGDVRVVGRENLPERDDQIPGPVYVCNHASQIDPAAVYFFDRRFKWIAKGSVVFLPGVGQVMWLGGHVLINRTKGKNKASVSALFTKSDAAVRSGIPML